MEKLSPILITSFILTLVALAAFAGVPQTINYQGYIADKTSGVPLNAPAPNGVNMTFSLYSSVQPRNNPVWRESAKPVVVTNGIYSTQLGSATPINAPFDVPYYLGVLVGTDPTEMLQPLSSTGYAFRAGVAESVTGANITNSNIVGPIDGSKITGSQITNLNASQLTSGTVPSSQLPANLVQTDLTQTFTTPHPFTDGSLMLLNSLNSAATMVNAPMASATRTISMPDASGTVITTGNLADINALGSPNKAFQIAGSLQIGADSSTCIASKGGSIRYTGGALEYCDGSNWATATILLRPAIWSGGCSIHGTTVGWNTYCLDVTEFNTASAFFTVNSNGTVTFLKSGYYRFNAYFVNQANGFLQVRFQKNGVAFYSGYDYSTGTWNGRNADVIYPFNAGDIFVMDVNNPSAGGYAYHSYSASGAFSRLQVMFVGPQ